MLNEKQVFYNSLNKWYKKLCNLNVFKCWTAAVIIAVIFDIVPFKYWKPFERIFSYNTGNVVAITVLIWTFMVTIVVYCFGKLDMRYYGIRMSDILIRDISTEKFMWLIIGVLGELFLLIIISFLEFEITIIVNALLQFYTMICIFLMISVKTSLAYVQEQIIHETHTFIESRNNEISGNMMLVQMIRYIDYNDRSDKDFLMHVLVDEISMKLQKGVQEVWHGNKIIMKQWANIISEEIANCILQSESDTVRVHELLKEWYMSVGVGLEIKQGIVKAVLDKFTPARHKLLGEIFEIELVFYKEIYTWSIVYNIYLHDYMGEEFRRLYTSELIKRFYFPRDEKDKYLALKYMEQLEGSGADMNILWRYIDS